MPRASSRAPELKARFIPALINSLLLICGCRLLGLQPGKPQHNGDSPVGPRGSCYMGGDNKGQGLDAEQSDQLNRMINEEAQVHDITLDLDSVGELPIIRTDAGGQNARVNGAGRARMSSSGVLQPKMAAEITWHQPASYARQKKRDSPGFL
ncbi:hypothetical protein FB451DRAFT_1170613 [Mycena latifolia]|nr:hypothetical protein FB451DRAFT_1170613 [Mycena latifolia]